MSLQSVYSYNWFILITILLNLSGNFSIASDGWEGPTDGPLAQPEKTVIYIAEDLKNAGILGVGEGVREAANEIGWHLVVLDLGSNKAIRNKVFTKARNLQPDAVILGGADAHASNHYLKHFAKADIPIIGWHVGPFPGPIAGTPVFTNITTDSLAVAETAARFAIEDSNGKAGVVIFTDSRFAIAMKKAELMAEAIRSCRECSLLAFEDISLAETAQQMPNVITRLMNQFGKRWTHSLGINDLYFDHAIGPLILAGLSPEQAPANISAGDGSPSALMRIFNSGYQKATVPEPLLMHGWQIIDELNRRFAGQQPSGFVNKPYLLTTKNITQFEMRHKPFDPNNDYRIFYRKIWHGNSLKTNETSAQ